LAAEGRTRVARDFSRLPARSRFRRKETLPGERCDVRGVCGGNDGIPHIRTLLIPPGGASREEDLTGANEAKVAKLRGRSLQRRARAQGIELRHSASGYALIDAARKPVQDRHDMTLDEVESWLERA